MARRLVPILIAAVAIGVAASVAGAEGSPQVGVLAEPVTFTDRAEVPAGMTAVFVEPAPDGFADGGDGFADGGDAPEGFTWVLAPPVGDGFADGGDVPEGFALVLAQPVSDEYWSTGLSPDGLVPVLAWPGDGFADGGDVPEGYVPVLLPRSAAEIEELVDGG
jgi:hypothetical protein